MFRRSLLYASLAGLATLAAASDSLAQVLTLEAARERALAQQPSLAALELNARAIEETAQAEGALPDPRVKLGLLNLPSRGFPNAPWEDMTQLVISYEQMVPGGRKRELRSERARAEAAQARAETLGQARIIRRDVSLAWLDAWQASANRRALDELAAEYSRAAELARIGVASGRTGQSEALAARQMIAQTADRRYELAAQAERARAMLRRWLPDAGAFELPADPPAWPDPAPLAALAEGLPRHPQQIALERSTGLAEAEVALANEASASDRTYEVGYALRQGQGRSDMVMFQAAFELPMHRATKQDRLLDSRLKLAERARAQRADQLRALRAELDATYADWRAATERLANFAQDLLPLARARLDTALAAQSAGRADLAAVFEARRALIEARLQEIALRAAQAKARVALEYLEPVAEAGK
jgi:cobalt-zinc-cadmium efflux system outer membrane protein